MVHEHPRSEMAENQEKKGALLGKVLGCFSQCGGSGPIEADERGSGIGPQGQYKVGRELAEGGYGRVCVATDTTNGSRVAIKFIKRGSNLVADYVKREILNHRTMRHANVIAFKQVFLTNEALCIVMEYAQGGDMHDYLGRHGSMKEDRARSFFQQLIVAMGYCHKRGVVLRDIKLENLLLDKRHTTLKLCDFGFSKHAYWDSVPDTCVGTPSYLAPEVLLGAYGGHTAKYNGVKVDIWTSGICLFNMLFGYNPYEDHLEPGGGGDEVEYNHLSVLDRIKTEPISIPRHQYQGGRAVPISDPCLDLLQQILERDPQKRIGFEDILKHPWFMYDFRKESMELIDKAETMDEAAIVQELGLQEAPEIETLVNEARNIPSPTTY